MSKDRGARFAALQTLLTEYAPRMRRLPPGLAYIRPAVFAYRDGFDEIGNRWAVLALQVGAGRLIRDGWGRELPGRHRAGSSGRPALRRSRHGAQSSVYRALAAARGVTG